MITSEVQNPQKFIILDGVIKEVPILPHLETSPLPTQWQMSRMSLLTKSLIATQEQRPDLMHILQGNNLAEEARIFFIEVIKDPKLRDIYLNEIDEITTTETLCAISEHDGIIKMDLLLLGSGPSGTAVAKTIRSKDPRLDMWTIDKRPIRGGTLATQSHFTLNSPRSGKNLGYLGELPSPNSIGDDWGEINFQLDDVAKNRFPDNEEARAVFSMLSFLAGPSLINVEIIPPLIIPNDPNGDLTINAIFNGKVRIILKPKAMGLFPGLGNALMGLDTQDKETQQLIDTRTSQIFDAEQWDKFASKASPQEIYDMIRKGIIFIGAGDSTNVALERIISTLRCSYSDKQIKRMRPIKVWGAKYKNGKEFIAQLGTVEDRYKDILPEFIGQNLFIQPRSEHVTRLKQGRKNIRYTLGNTTQREEIGTVVGMAGYANDALRQLLTNTYDEHGHRVMLVQRDIIGIDNSGIGIIGRQLGDTRIFIGGAALKLPPDRASETPRLSASIRRNVPRARNLATTILNSLTQYYSASRMPTLKLFR